MHFITLPCTDLRVSSLCLGTGSFGADISEADSFALLDQFAEAGGNFLDTAAIYADWTPAGKGSSERTIGRWMKARGNGDGIVVGTKGAHPELATMGVPRMTRREIESDVDDSLRYLGIESIPLYYLHRDDPGTPVEEILTTLEFLVTAGKLRYYACSNWKLNRIEVAHEAAAKLGVQGFAASQPMWSLAAPDMTGGDQTLAPMTQELRDWHAAHDFPAIPYSSQANGFFNKVIEGRESDIGAMTSALYDSETVRATNRARASRLEHLAGESGQSITALVLGYLLSQSFPTIPIVGCRTEAQLADSVAGADAKLSAEQLVALDSPIG